MENTSNPTDQNTETSTKGSAAEQLIDKILGSGAVLFNDQYREPYIAPLGDGRQVLKLTSSDFTRLLARMYWVDRRKALPRDTDKQVVQTLSAYADFDGDTYDLHVRVAKNENILWYDLADGRAVKVTSKEWEVVERPPILFRKMQQNTQVEPEHNGELGLLRSYVNVATDQEWILFLAFTVAAFIPNFPHPLLVLHGPQGAGKTTPMRVIKQLVDPSVVQGVPLPNEVAEFVQLADHHAFLFFDNLSNLSTKMSDALARAATGDSFSKRVLFTNDDDKVYSIQKPMALTGINQVISKADLLDRSILIGLKRIAQDERIPEDEFWEAFNHDKPQILGAIFDTLVKAMSIYPTVQLTKLPRMADFNRWGCAIAEAAGYAQQDFLDAYEMNIEGQNDEAIDASPIAKAVINLMEDDSQVSIDGMWQGTPEQLFVTLNKRPENIHASHSPLWPKSPEWVTRRLNDAAVNLSVVGIHIEIYRKHKGRFIVISKKSDSVSAMSVNKTELT